MKADGTIWIDTKIDESGMEDGFNRMRDGADDVATSFRNAGKVIENSFSGINFNKTIENLKSQIKGLEAEFDAVTREFNDAIQFDDDKSAERLGAKRSKIYDRIARAREKLAVEVAAAAEKEAAAEEKASRRVLAAEEKEAVKRKQLNNDLVNAGNSASYFGTRLRSIVSGALVFNVISAGLRKVTSYFGSALMANNQFASAVYRLQGSLMVAFQPIYESVLPALITLINWLNVAVQAVARFFAILAGKDYKNMQKNAQQLNNTMNSVGSSAGSLKDTAGSVDKVGDAIKDTGKEAKKAEKYLAGFDEINRLLKDDAEDLSSSLDNLGDLYDELENLGNLGNLGLDDFKGPIFEDVELPKEWETAIDKLVMRFKDIFFEWENLTPENIAEKLLTALTTIAGGLIGFVLGGPGGALIGMVVGAGLGVVLSSLIFDGDGKLSPEELLKSLVLALGIIGGGIIGFTVGHSLGAAAIGIVIGAALSIAIASIIFDGDGKLSPEELIKSIVVALGIIGGGIIGFVVGGSFGAAAIGIVVGASLSIVIASLIFDEDGNISVDGITEALIITLGAVAGGIIGFQIGGPGGALIGVILGAGIVFTLSGMIFENDGTLTYEELVKGLYSVILPLGGAGLGFAVGGGPAGAIIGFVIGSFLSFVIQKANVTAEEGAISGEKLISAIVDIFSAVAIIGLTMVMGGIAGGPAGAAMGAIIGLVASFRLLGIEFGEIQLGFDGLRKKISEWSKQTTQTVEDGFIKPTSTGMQNLQKEMTTSAEQTKDSIQQNMEIAANKTVLNFFEPLKHESTRLSDKMSGDNDRAARNATDTWNEAAGNIERDFINYTDQNFDRLGENILNSFFNAERDTRNIFQNLRRWFQENVTSPIYEVYNDMVDSIARGLNRLANAISDIFDSFNSARAAINSYRNSVANASVAAAPTMMYAATPAIPQLARGAVIPPNHKFLAVLGDQKHGTNIEAPLATIQEAVALVMADMIPAMIAGFEAVVNEQIATREAVENIEIDGATLYNSLSGYRRKMAVTNGSPLPW